MGYTIDRSNFALKPEALASVTGTYTLSASEWGIHIQGIQIPLQLFQLNTINIPPADMSIWADCNVYPTSEDIRPDTGYITFRCDTAPAEDLTFTVIQTPLNRVGDYEGTGDTITKYTGDDIDIEIPRGAFTIDSGAFEGSAVQSVEFPDMGLQTIGSGAFKDCTALTTMKFYEPVAIRADMFSGCTAVNNVDLYVLDDSWNFGMDLTFTDALTAECLGKIVTKLYDYSGGVGNVLKLGYLNKSRLSPAQLAAAAAKNWVVL